MCALQLWTDYVPEKGHNSQLTHAHVLQQSWSKPLLDARAHNLLMRAYCNKVSAKADDIKAVSQLTHAHKKAEYTDFICIV